MLTYSRLVETKGFFRMEILIIHISNHSIFREKREKVVPAS